MSVTQQLKRSSSTMVVSAKEYETTMKQQINLSKTKHQSPAENRRRKVVESRGLNCGLSALQSKPYVFLVTQTIKS